jgi:hypothetical protein
LIFVLAEFALFEDLEEVLNSICRSDSRVSRK